MSNALLLRLFTSEFFNSWIAVSYLFRYSDNVGIQHYLCAELKSFPISEIEFFLPQLIHLLITKPSDSVALECFLIEMFEKSTHIALMSLWYLQAYLSDLCANPSSPSFELCKRLLNKAQAVVFAEEEHAIEESLSQRMIHHQQRNSQKVRENPFPALVGMGAVLLGIGQPLMTKPAGRIAIAQGRRNRINSIHGTTHPSSLVQTAADDDDHHHHDSFSPLSSTNQSVHLDVSSSHHHHHYLSSSQPDLPVTSLSKKKKSHPYFSPFASSPSLEDLHRGKAFSVTRYIKSAQHKINKKMIQLGEEQLTVTSPLSDHNSLRKKKGKQTSFPSVFDPTLTALGQSTVPTNTAPLSPALSHYHSSSSEEIITTDHPHSSSEDEQDPFLLAHQETKQASSSSSSSSSHNHDHDSVKGADSPIRRSFSKLSIDHRKLLLRSNYFRSEMQFVLALVDIATRLVIVPKEARMSALHAELTLLNHNLPAEICLPLWCPATAEKPYHHRIVRISPTDAVVLNSAERAPYLLMIEVLDDEMSFEESSYLSPSGHYYCRHQHHRPKRSHSKRTSISLKKEEDDDTVADIGEMRKKKAMMTNEQDINIQKTTTTTTTTSSSTFADDYAERMRTAAVMLAQLQSPNIISNYSNNSSGNSNSNNNSNNNSLNGGINSSLFSKYRLHSSSHTHNTEHIRRKIIKEMMALEEERMKKIKIEGVGSVVQGTEGGSMMGGDRLLEDKEEHMMAWVKMKNNKANNDDPSAVVLSEDWETKKERLRRASPFGHLPNWHLLSVIVKHGADLRQEQFAIQLIREMQRIWEDTGVNVWVKYFRILVTSDSSGLIETLRNTISIHSIKKTAYTRGWNQKGAVYTLYDYYEKIWGPPDSDEFLKAQDAFMRSLTGYSIACYVLQIKDRHNGNLLIDDEGHLIHIDFGFMLSNSPGSVGFEMAPFKLPQEYIDILGGVHGEKFAEYKALMKAAFLAVRKHSENILLLTEMMSKDSNLPCFQNGDMTVSQLRDRFQLQLTEPQAEEFVDKLIMSSCCNVFTRLYDTFQYYSQVSLLYVYMYLL
ncbi:kinase-like domain-containing protein [Cokeromyces recurvatus]|uniref:kinase-like domain-containing protein n=1 Tax=Cokeromyces recurvatus TaxID=90255 RepID=UPI00221ED7BC|nr:kinase-like domain-containing protein [Cokeromyces recurvatus]KAI7906146.1 kinase-like domain-containing protein [Cokeromyces recurvatus]